MRVTWIVAAVLILAAWARADVEPPVAHMPPNFSGAIGDYRIATRATPTDVEAEDPLVLTVTITGTGPLKGVVRPDLRKLPQFARRFHIDDGPERDLPKTNAREYDYRLRPRSPAVKEIPSLPFVFFKPGFRPAYKGYQTRSAPAIPLTVRPRDEVPATAVQGPGPPIQAPEELYQLVPGERVLVRQEPFALPGPLGLAGLLLGPPVACAAWYALWRRRHPDEARQHHQRRSGAANQALRAMHTLGRRRPDDAAAAAGVLADYLRQRYDLTPAEPTPAEVADRLRRGGVSATAAEKTAAFFRSCDASRFAPDGSGGSGDWSDAAAQLVLALEAEPCSFPAS
jgi:hypothetical protein